MTEPTLFDHIPEVAQKNFGRFRSSNYSPDHFHNTEGLIGDKLQAREMRADAQGRIILAYFRQHPGESFTPYQIMRALGFGPFQLQSVRRSMTNLTQCIEHYLYMTGEKRVEQCGDENNCWALNTRVSQTGFTLTIPKAQKNFECKTV